MTAHLRRLPAVLAVAGSTVVLFGPTAGLPAGPAMSDRLVHVLLFAVLAGTLRLAGATTTWTAGGLLAYAVVSELLQPLVPWALRSGEVGDVLADALGVLLGLAAWALASRSPRVVEARGRTRG